MSDIVRDTAKMAVDLTPEGLRVEFAVGNGDVIRLRLNSFGEAMTFTRNLLHAICTRWPKESSGMQGGGK